MHCSMRYRNQIIRALKSQQHYSLNMCVVSRGLLNTGEGTMRLMANRRAVPIMIVVCTEVCSAVKQTKKQPIVSMYTVVLGA